MARQFETRRQLQVMETVLHLIIPLSVSMYIDKINFNVVKYHPVVLPFTMNFIVERILLLYLIIFLMV